MRTDYSPEFQNAEQLQQLADAYSSSSKEMQQILAASIVDLLREESTSPACVSIQEVICFNESGTDWVSS
jgi:hypothetical protein